jgi:hypothetical protein
MKLKIMMNNRLFSLAIVGLMLACTSSTKIQKSWSDQSLIDGTATPFTKVLIIAAFINEDSRKIAEDKIIANITNITAVPSYIYLKTELGDQKQIEEKLKNDGFNGIILMRLTDVNNSVTYTPGTVYDGWYGNSFDNPGYYTEDKTFMVETNFYSLESYKLLWSGVTSTLNPTQLDLAIDEIVTALKNELFRQGLIKK